MIRRISMMFAIALIGAFVGISLVPANHAQTVPEVYFFAPALNVADIERSEQFYEQVFGLKRTFRYPPEGGGAIIDVGMKRPEMAGGGTLVLAHFNDDPLPAERTEYGRLLFNSTDAVAVAKRAEALGAETKRLPGGPEGSVIMRIIDPDGYELELYQDPVYSKKK